MSRRALLFTLIALFACCEMGFVVNAKAQTHITDEEYSINSALINDLFIVNGTKLVVIHDQTSFFRRADNVEKLAKHLRRIQKEFPSVSQELLEDFKAKNSQPYDLEKLFDLKARYEFISRQEINNFFMGNDPGAWKSFYTKYPNSTGIIGVGRVGFNKNKSQALAYVGNRRSESSVESFFVFLVKENGVWRIEKKLKSSV